MRVKTFEAASMQEALNIVKREMGEEAFILSTRTKQKKGSQEEAIIEVTAAVDENAPAQAPPVNGGKQTYGLRPPLSVTRAAEPAPRPMPAPAATSRPAAAPPPP